MNLKAIHEDLREFESVSLIDGYVSTRKQEEERIWLAKDGKVPQGLETGFPQLDDYFRYKQGNLVIMNGHDNVGKSFIVWYLMVIASVKYDWKWIMFCGENQSPDIRTQIVEFMCGKIARFIDEETFKEKLDFAYSHFEIIEIAEDKEEVETLNKILSITESIIEQNGKVNGLLIDPYNALEIDMGTTDFRLSTHDYHYSCSNTMRRFKKKNDITIWVNMHAVSEALRRTDNEGYPLPPGKADTEGGGKFANKADEFITWHRYVQDSSRSRTTEMHVRKVKDTKTGGKPTDLSNPIILTWESHNGFHGFYDESGVCPLAKLKKPDLPMSEPLPVTGKELTNFELYNELDKADKKPVPF